MFNQEVETVEGSPSGPMNPENGMGTERPAVGFNATLKRLLWVVSQTRKSMNILARKLRQNLGKELSAFEEKLALSVG